ncbi:hypothetical protein [Serratia sp. Ag1]|uniref:hypothetical protein n=1 Tax=Serratia sp. Ag1 TaxID=1524467 RepID=UPI00056CE693|nr:hypothetical protein [Serratia sp. Ag1]
MNNHKVIDYARMGEDYVADAGGIEDAMRRIDMPVYVIYRHGIYKRFLSRSAAIDNLARIMATEVYKRQGLEIRYDSAFDPQKNVWVLGNLTLEYLNCRYRAKRRILRLLAKRREIVNWQKEYDAWASKHDELMKRRPY